MPVWKFKTVTAPSGMPTFPIFGFCGLLSLSLSLSPSLSLCVSLSLFLSLFVCPPPSSPSHTHAHSHTTTVYACAWACVQGCAVVCETMDEAVAISDKLAPEHLEIQVACVLAVACHVRHVRRGGAGRGR